MPVKSKCAVAVLIATLLLGNAAHSRGLVTSLAADRSAAPATPNAYPALRTLVKRIVAEGTVPGIVIAIGRGGSAPTILSAGRIGLAPGRPSANADSIWRIYSMTKPITGTALMLLIEDGKIGLDQDVGDFIPSFRHPRVLTGADDLATRPAKGPVTVRMLLTHSSGLGYTFISTDPLAADYRRRGLLPFQVSPTMEAGDRGKRAPSLAAFADRAGAAPLMFEPGTRWSYSIGLDVAARLVEVVSGERFEKFLETRLFGPLGMHDTAFQVPRAKLDRLADDPLYIFDRLTPLDPGGAGSVYARAPGFPYGGAGLVSTAHDYDRFLAMLLGGGALDGVRIMKPETARLATSNLMPATVVYAGVSGGGDPASFGAGGSVSVKDAKDGPGAGTFMWAGAAGTLGWVDTKNNLRVSVMVNFMPSDVVPLYSFAHIAKAIYAPGGTERGDAH